MKRDGENSGSLLPGFEPHEDYARKLDAADPLARFRDRFHIPKRADGRDAVYLAGNSLGLQPKTVRPLIEQELQDWADLAVDAHFQAKTPWYTYHEVLRESAARLVGADPGEVVMMNSLTANLHLMMVSFYRPTPERHKIVIENAAFPSDTYAVKSQLRHHGFDPEDALIVVKPRDGEHTLRTEAIEQLLAERGSEIALVMMAGVNFLTGQVFDMKRVTDAARRVGCAVGWDLAHAVGNVPLSLHDWNVDFAVWCSYKYLNSGPGAVAGCFVHETHGRNLDLNRFAGWWGNDPKERFKMHLLPDFVPRAGADGWQLSNPPILAMAPIRASLNIFDEVGMAALRAKSVRLTAYLRYLIEQTPSDHVEIITPRDADGCGCQLSILAHDRPKERFAAIEQQGIVCDFREPNVIRAAAVPLYNTYRDAWTFAQALAHCASA